MANELITLGNTSKPTTVLWSPRSGDAIAHLRRLLIDERELPDSAAFDSIEHSATEILSRCSPPTDGSPQARTGLVVGYVQSGKTMSMTSVACLARDNGFGLVVVLAGTTDILLDQSWRRFKRYLQLHSGPRRHWYMLTSANNELRRNTDGLRASLDTWRSNRERRASAFIVAMKNHAHLDQLAEALRRSGGGHVPALVIDDEADQAGLNTNPNGPPSTTYSRIRAVRAALNAHTYLQYTATPQAPLLISIAEHLSPDFSVVLDAGRAYTGGKTFFRDCRRALVRSIPQNDIGSAGNPPTELPESLLTSLRVFFVGVALGYHRTADAQKNRSMLVHPSPQQTDHNEYYNWVVNVCTRWKQTLRLDPADPDYLDLRRDFEGALADLKSSGVEVPPFEDLAEDLADALGATLVHRVNSDSGTEVDWSNAYAHILVGGQKLNRGYTVEGLTVTYMPRSAGTWTADTIQQLARFYGYKRKYLDLCRTFLNPDLVDVFDAYVDHEEDLRAQLKAHPGPLKEWYRALYLPTRMRPTRQQVLVDPYYRVDPTGWLIQTAPFDDAILSENRRLVADFTRKISSFSPYPGAERHKVAEVGLGDLMEWLLYGYRVVGDHDESRFYAARYIIASLLQREGDALALVVDMGAARRSARGAEIVKLHQGYDRKTMGRNYPGAAKIFDPQLATVQIHDLTVTFGADTSSIPNVPTLAIHLPPTALAKAMIVQPTPAHG